MKIYIDGLVPEKVNINNIKQYFDKKTDVTLFYTLDGIFENINDKLFQLEINDHDIEKKQLRDLDIDLILDKSKMVKNQVVYQIPPDYIFDNYIKEIYLLRRQSKLALTLHKKGDNIIDAYIETTENLENDHYHQDFLTLISLLTNIN